MLPELLLRATLLETVFFSFEDDRATPVSSIVPQNDCSLEVLELVLPFKLSSSVIPLTDCELDIFELELRFGLSSSFIKSSDCLLEASC